MAFEKGQTVYAEDGQEFEYVAAVDGGHVVQPSYFRSDDDEPYFATPIVVEQVFAAPLTVKYHTEVAKLDEQLAAKRDELAAIRSELNVLVRDEKARMARLKQHQALALLDDYLAGKISHFVVVPEYSGRIEVQTFAEALASQDRYDKDMKLLSLYGGSNGDLQWRIHRYSDGSGNNKTDVYPFLSEAEAIAGAQRIIAERLAALEDRALAGYSSTEELLRAAERYGVPVPADLLAKRHAGLLALKEKEVAEKEAALAKAQAELHLLTGGA